MTFYLVDNSVWARWSLNDQRILDRMSRIGRSPSDFFVTCPPQILEFCHSARTPEEYEHHRRVVSLGFPLEHAPADSLLLDIQRQLWNKGLVRAAGAIDIVIAGYAIVNDATVLCCDRDYEYIARVSDLHYEYIPPST